MVREERTVVEVAEAVLYLCQDATFTTGMALTVAGGLTAD